MPGIALSNLQDPLKYCLGNILEKYTNQVRVTKEVETTQAILREKEKDIFLVPCDLEITIS